MFDTTATIRALALAGLRPQKVKTAPTFVEIEGPGEKVEGHVEKPVRNPAWYAPEWWEHRNYDHR